MPLTQELVDFLEKANKLNARLKARGTPYTPENSRKRMNALTNFMSVRPDVAHVEDRVITHEGRNIPVRVYSPDPEKELPVLMYYHGGGHMCGSVELYDPITRKIALAANVVVVSVDYRRAPEHPYPADVDDARVAVRKVWSILDNVSRQKRLFTCGDSGGGALAASVVMNRRDAAELNIEKQVLIYPSVDYTTSGNSHGKFGAGFFLDAEKIHFYHKNYFQHGEDRRAASPLFGDFSGHMPKTLVLTAEFDPLRDEGLMYYEKVKEQGVRAEHHCFPGMIHAFMNLEDLVPRQTTEVYERIAGFLQGEFNDSPPTRAFHDTPAAGPPLL